MGKMKSERKTCTRGREPMSKVRKQYMARFVGRCVILAVCAWLLWKKPESYGILEGWAFFEGFSLFHLLWLIWVFDMVCQVVPLHKELPLGSQKLFAARFRPVLERVNRQALHSYVVTTTKAAYKVFLLWASLIAVIGVLHKAQLLTDSALLFISVVFYVCDLICVLFWCPFRLILKNRCCTTCRIFNWDHLMMFSPMLFLFGFYGWSLLGLAIVAWGVWELCVLLFPERFWEFSNEALQCSQCTDKLCTQYCQKLRR